MYKKILVPYDDSKLSEKALAHGMNLAKAFNAEIIILYVIQEIPMPLLGLGKREVFSTKTGETMNIKEYIQDLYKEMNIKMREKIKKRIEGYHYPNVNIEILIGEPPKVIIKVTKEENIDLIVIGAAPLPGLARIKALGSVSRSVIESVNIPVLLVH